MQTSSFFHRLTPTGACFSGGFPQSKSVLVNHRSLLTTMAFKNDRPSGKTVDENMIVLRERIRKLKAEMEYGGGEQLPDNWMEWEKTYTYSGGYHSDIFEGIALLQRFLMETRPSVALGLVAGLAFSGSTVAMEVLWWLVNSVHGN
ncbi:hypothetical protein L2E82_08512 [Cichorium intybus]|uniref:Uncharacterized protein n=1 Tax=Cichorium intybus TaxID=13427 RepID=A0ACB9G6K9_CICIN|nr:hypothetical protein L2E82_08512 [Cichorium intybus]